MDFKPIKILKRCKSDVDVSAIKDRRDSGSECSEVFVVNGCSSASGSDDEGDKDVLGLLEMKIDRLSELFLEQCSLLTEMKDDVRESRELIEQTAQAQTALVADLMAKALRDRPCASALELEPSDGAEAFSGRARSLLDAIEARQGFCPERALRDALADCLRSQELKEQMISATVASVREMVRDNFWRDMSRLYVPVLQRNTRRLARMLTRTVEDGFLELEAHSSQLANSMCRVSRSLRRALDRNQALLEGGGKFSYLRFVVEETLEKEMQQWRHLALDALSPAPQHDAEEWAERGATPPPLELEYPTSPLQPANPGCSIIDQLMTTAQINKQIQDGDVNAAFECALSAADLSLVMAACRACDPGTVFSPCRLRQSTLLSLAQQLPTDMVHDTPLKCRYLEEALINLNPLHPGTRMHLPLVVGEIRKNLTGFLSRFPSHVANKRITLIIMAADNLLK